MSSGITGVFFITFISIILFSGCWFPLVIAFLISCFVSFGVRRFVNKRFLVENDEAVLITGCSTGIGKDAVLRLSGLGYLVFAGVRNEEDGEALRLDSKIPENIIPLILDVTQREHIVTALETVKHKLKENNKRLISLINNAGYSEASPLETLPIERLKRQFEVNVFGAVHVSQAFIPLLRNSASPNRTSRLIFMSSYLGRINAPIVSPYTASKHALESFVDAFRVELKKFNVDVISIQPGDIKTPFAANAESVIQDNLNWVDQNQDKLYCSTDTVKTYKKMVQNHVETARKFANGRSPSLVSDEIVNAMLDSSPYTRYQAGIDSRYVAHFFEILPDSILDFLVGISFYRGI